MHSRPAGLNTAHAASNLALLLTERLNMAISWALWVHTTKQRPARWLQTPLGSNLCVPCAIIISVQATVEGSIPLELQEATRVAHEAFAPSAVQRMPPHATLSQRRHESALASTP